jgi:hypothetical protein
MVWIGNLSRSCRRLPQIFSRIVFGFDITKTKSWIGGTQSIKKLKTKN